MDLLHPYALLGLVPVAAVALWALLRPARRTMIVASVSLWREALASPELSRRRRDRRLTLSWALLAAGATAAVLAAAGPVVRRTASSRRVAVAVVPSAELGRAEGSAVRPAVELLKRLDGVDRVQLLLPAVLGGARKWLPPAEARRRLDRLYPLPAAASELTLPPASPDAQHVYRFAVSNLAGESDERTTALSLSPTLPPVTVDALGAADLPDGSVQVYVRLASRNGWTGNVSIEARSRAGGTLERRERRIDIPAGGSRSLVEELPQADAFTVRAADRGGRAGFGSSGYLARRSAGTRRVAILGRDSPLLRRFVEAHPGLEPAADVGEADLAFVTGADAPPALPALLVDPPTAPPGWRRAPRPVGPVMLGEASVAADDPLMRNVDLAGVALRRVTPWVTSGDASPLRVVAAFGEGALILRTDPDAPTTAGPRRVCVAVPIDLDNTNFAATDAFVIFLANVSDWLAPDADAPAAWSHRAPLEVGPRPGWRAVVDGGDGPAGLPLPGLYADQAGELHAVGLVGLRADPPADPPDIAAVALPAPQPGRVEASLWRYLAILAVIAWLAGWAARGRL